jgi:hypothetical protein
MSVATQVQRRRGSQAQHATFTGKIGEFTFDTDLKTIRAHDGALAGGWIMLRQNSDGSIPLGQFTVSADGTTLTSTNSNTNFKIKNGQIYIWDEVAYTANPSLPWRIFGCNNGQSLFSDPVAG